MKLNLDINLNNFPRDTGIASEMATFLWLVCTFVAFESTKCPGLVKPSCSKIFILLLPINQKIKAITIYS